MCWYTEPEKSKTTINNSVSSEIYLTVTNGNPVFIKGIYITPSIGKRTWIFEG